MTTTESTSPALAVACPVCGAQPSHHCRNSLGRITEAHPNRHFAWDRAGRPSHLSVPGARVDFPAQEGPAMTTTTTTTSPAAELIAFADQRCAQTAEWLNSLARGSRFESSYPRQGDGCREPNSLSNSPQLRDFKSQSSDAALRVCALAAILEENWPEHIDVHDALALAISHVAVPSNSGDHHREFATLRGPLGSAAKPLPDVPLPAGVDWAYDWMDTDDTHAKPWRVVVISAWAIGDVVVLAAAVQYADSRIDLDAARVEVHNRTSDGIAAISPVGAKHLAQLIDKAAHLIDKWGIAIRGGAAITTAEIPFKREDLLP
jgi:hypothetical protein